MTRATWRLCAAAFTTLLATFGLPLASTADITVDLASGAAWTFKPDRPNAIDTPIRVLAGGWRLNGFPNDTAGAYQLHVRIPRLPAGAQVDLLRFEAVNWEATVFAGPDTEHLHKAGYHLSAWTPFTVDITPYVNSGADAIVRVIVRDRTFFRDASGRYTVPAGACENDAAARGIIRAVSLDVRPAVYIEDLFVKPNTRDDTLMIEAYIMNSTNTVQTASIGGSLSSETPGSRWTYPAVPEMRGITIAAHAARAVTIGPIHWTPGRPSWWWPNIPYAAGYRAQLHALTAIVRVAGGASAPAASSVTFGFCSSGQTGPRYALNGVDINLRGDTLPESTIGTDAFARLEGFLPPTRQSPGWPGAVRNYQRLNYNVILFHQAPCTRYMMAVCDRLGMLVIPETAICSGPDRSNLSDRPADYVTQVRELVLRDRNHPCVFKWSLESGLAGAPEPFVKALYDACMSADGTRPCSIDDNATYPTWPAFAAIQRYSQPPGTPDAEGGSARSDAPHGQGAYVWPEDTSPAGPLWFAAETRAMREHDNADLRPYCLTDVWPGAIPGLKASALSNRRAHGGSAALDGADIGLDLRALLIKQSFAPVAVYDRQADALNTPSDGEGEWPTVWPALESGHGTTRALVAFNDDLRGDSITLTVTPTLRPANASSRPLPRIVRQLKITPGSRQEVSVEIPLPQVEENTALEINCSASKGGVTRYSESHMFVVVPSGTAGSAATYAGRDDSTRGDWPARYGKQAFMVPVIRGRASFQIPAVSIWRGEGEYPAGQKGPLGDSFEEQDTMVQYASTPSVNDPRVQLHGPGMTRRDPTAFAGKQGVPLVMRIGSTDAQWHMLALYLLDFKRARQSVDVAILDLAGHPLDTRRVASLDEGAYIKYRFRGTVLVEIKGLADGTPTLSGAFIDPDHVDKQVMNGITGTAGRSKSSSAGLTQALRCSATRLFSHGWAAESRLE